MVGSPGDHDRATSASGAGAPPRSVRDPGGRRAGVGGLELAEPDSLCRAAPSDHPPAGRGGGTAGQYSVQGRGRLRPAAGLVPWLRQLLLASCPLTPATAIADPDQRDGFGKVWRPYTPAMAAGLTDRVWTLREVGLLRVPPVPQPAVREPVGHEGGWAKGV